jgi:CRISPR-associated protein Csb2
MPCLLISVRFHDGRYHGRPEWPPSPARLFQALLAGAAQGETLAAEDQRAFEWLESLEAPAIAAPLMQAGQSLRNYVPNNDLDAVSGDPARISKIRAPKFIRPILFDTDTPLLYAWTFGHGPEAQAWAHRLCAVTGRLYQFGRGVDMAWARGEVLDDSQLEARFAAHLGVGHRPGGGAGGTVLAVPLKGSLASLIERHKKMRARFQSLYESKPTKKESVGKVSIGQIFVQPPKPRFQQVAYASPPTRLLFDLVGEITPWPLGRVVDLTERVRDAVTQKLREKLPHEADDIYNAIVGRRNAQETDKAARVRITPLPSIGHQHADHAIRRVMVEVPPNCPLRLDDLEWAFSGVEVVNSAIDSETGEVRDQVLLAPAAETGMLAHYGVEQAGAARQYLWRTVTPAALPLQAARRRVDPARRRLEAKGGAERAGEESKAIASVAQALRHAGIASRPLAVRVQREPFEANGARAEYFAAGTRFAKERLWHVEVAFAEGVCGPQILGDGRYLGLGLMRPIKAAWRDIVAFSLPPNARIPAADRRNLLRAVRRALMALSRDDKGNVPPLFSGHQSDGAPANSGHHKHVFLAGFDLDRNGDIEQLVVAAPWACDHSTRASVSARTVFNRVVPLLKAVRAGELGVIPLRISSADERLMGPSQDWISHTDYRPCRHGRHSKDPTASLLRDVTSECERRGLPKPEIELLDLSVGPNEGLGARLRLRFAVAVSGPILLGRDSHQGGGLFEATVP